MCCHSLIYHGRNTKISMLFSGICLRYYLYYLYTITFGNKSKAEACKLCFEALDVESGRGEHDFLDKIREISMFLKVKSRNSGKNKSKWLCVTKL